MGHDTSSDTGGRGALPRHFSTDFRWRRGRERDDKQLEARAAGPRRYMLTLAATLAMMIAITNLPAINLSHDDALRFAQAHERLDQFDLEEPIEVMLDVEVEEAESEPAGRPRALDQMPVEMTVGPAEEVRRDPPRMRPAKMAAAVGAAVPTTALPYGADWLAAQTVMLENVDTPPRMRSHRRGRHLEIEYPKAARREGIEGNVVLGFVVDLDGRTQDVEVLKPLHPLCDSAAVRALRVARFDPGQESGKTVRVRAKLSILFQLIGY